jgi:hypothetical protein
MTVTPCCTSVCRPCSMLPPHALHERDSSRVTCAKFHVFPILFVYGAGATPLTSLLWPCVTLRLHRAQASVDELTRSLSTKKLMDVMIVRCPNSSPTPPSTPTSHEAPSASKRIRLDAGRSLLPPLEPPIDAMCSWTGQLRDLSEHRESCMFEKVLCDCGCNSLFERQLLSGEGCPSREVSCSACSETMAARQIKSHGRTCSRGLVPCPRGCGADVERCEVDAHEASNCPKAMVDCP